jgi:SAM-dependent methyltransferase
LLARLGRQLRDVFLRILEPFERLLSPAVRRGAIPPISLRRHSGPIRFFVSSAREFDAWIERLGLLHENDRILDVGCGPGAMALRFSRRSWHGTYVGFDVHERSIRWCQRRFDADPRFHFELAEVRSIYGSLTDRPPATYRFPLKDAEAQLVIAKSVFTHLLDQDARHYVQEIARVLEPGRGALVTAFLFDPASRTGRSRSDFFRITAPDRALRYRRASRPEAAVAYEISRFREMIGSAGLRILWTCFGFFPGDDPRPRGQDLLLLGR